MKRLRHDDIHAGNDPRNDLRNNGVTTSKPCSNEACNNRNNLCLHRRARTRRRMRAYRRACVCGCVCARSERLLRLLPLLQASRDKGFSVTTLVTTSSGIGRPAP